MHGLGEMEPMSLMGLGQMDYSSESLGNLSMGAKVGIGVGVAALLGAGVWWFMFRKPECKTGETPDKNNCKAPAGLAGRGYFSGLAGRGYFSGLGRGYYDGWQGQGDSGTAFQAAGRGYNYGRYF